MRNIFIVLFCLCMSLIGTMIGALIGVSIKNPSKKFLGFIFSFAAGLMLMVSAFELIPEAIEVSNMKSFLVFFSIGILTILIINYFSAYYTKDNNIKIALLISLGIMLHNFPEGLIMGVGFMAGGNLGLKMSILIAIHDIPEGISVAAPLKYSKVSSTRIMIYAFLTALPALIGSLVGIFLGSISDLAIGASLSIAAGIMLYVTLFEMIPKSREICGIKVCTFGLTIGSIIGICIIVFM